MGVLPFVATLPVGGVEEIEEARDAGEIFSRGRAAGTTGGARPDDGATASSGAAGGIRCNGTGRRAAPGGVGGTQVTLARSRN